MRHIKKIVYISWLGTIVFLVFVVINIIDYIQYKQAEASAEGYAIECGIINTKDVIPNCILVDGVCTCPLCQHYCYKSTEIDFVAQPTPKCPVRNWCISPEFSNYTGGPPKPGDQAIVGAMSNVISANAVYGTPSVGVRGIDKLVNAFKYAIAGFKK